MIVVADSGPLHYLILLDQTQLLRRFYGQLLIPEAVLRELTVDDTPKPVREWLSHPPAWLRVQAAPPNQVKLVTADLDLGEQEAIALAELLRADLLLIDELAGRTEARRRGLRVTGTLGILRAAAELDLIDIREILVKLRETSFYVDDDLLTSIFGKWLDGESC
jgi:predicted nucleic acid-binding protein